MRVNFNDIEINYDNYLIDDMVLYLSKKYSLDCVDGVFEIIIRDREDWDNDESEFNKVFPHDGTPKEILNFLIREAYEYAIHLVPIKQKFIENILETTANLDKKQ